MTDAPKRAQIERAQIELQVPFYDVDVLGVVWHGHYLKYMDQARSALLGAHRLDGADLVATGFRFLVIESEVKHVFPLHYGDRLRVSAWFRDVAHRIDIAYEITNLTFSRPAARARTVLATLDGEGRLRLRTPEVIRERLEGVS